ncbi:hypothetical protein C8R45DRAFT_923437 [Mycena sanguinolenta]|nr:hypothetical protein C8R45DRAFT_923437 [Mycena sanguinolenta]
MPHAWVWWLLGDLGKGAMEAREANERQWQKAEGHFRRVGHGSGLCDDEDEKAAQYDGAFTSAWWCYGAREDTTRRRTRRGGEMRVPRTPHESKTVPVILVPLSCPLDVQPIQLQMPFSQQVHLPLRN